LKHCNCSTLHKCYEMYSTVCSQYTACSFVGVAVLQDC